MKKKEKEFLYIIIIIVRYLVRFSPNRLVHPDDITIDDEIVHVIYLVGIERGGSHHANVSRKLVETTSDIDTLEREKEINVIPTQCEIPNGRSIDWEPNTKNIISVDD